MDISIVIPNYNGRDIVLENLPKIIESVASYKYGQIEIIITDDASKDGSITAIKHLVADLQSNHMSFQLLENTSGRNVGFSGNVNKGVAHAKGELVVLLNSDVTPKKNFLNPILSHFEDKRVFAVGCMDESVEDGNVVLRGRGVGMWEKGFLRHSAGNVDKTTTLWVGGGSGVFRKSVWDKLGGLNNLYNPFYWEDIDLSYRAQKAGYKVLFEPKSVVIHEHSKGAIKKNYSPFNVRKTAYRNQFFFVWLNATDTSLVLQHIFWLPYHVLRALKNKDKAFFYGFWLALIKLPHVIAYRNKMVKQFIITDKEVINSL